MDNYCIMAGTVFVCNTICWFLCRHANCQDGDCVSKAFRGSSSIALCKSEKAQKEAAEKAVELGKEWLDEYNSCH